MMDILQVQPAEMSFITSLLWLPWAFKPLFGFVTDRYRINNSRLPYLILGITLNALLWFGIYSSIPYLNHDNRYLFYIMNFCCFTAFVLSETTVDAILATKARMEVKEDTGKLQSQVWTLDAAGSVLSTLAVTFIFWNSTNDASSSKGSSAATKASERIFLACGILVTVSGLMLPWVSEKHDREDTDNIEGNIEDNKNKQCSQVAVPAAAAQLTTEPPPEEEVDEEEETSMAGTQGLLVNQSTLIDCATAHHDHNEQSTDASESIPPPPPATTTTTKPSLSMAFADPRLCKCLFFVFVVSSSPTSGDAFFYYQRDRLGFTLEFLACMGVARTCLNLVAAFMYWKWWRKAEYQIVFRNAILLGFVVGIANVMVTERWNVWLGIPDHMFIFGDTVVQGIAGEIVFMPVAVLAAKLAPSGLEGTVYATTMSVVNISWMFSSLYSGILASLLGVQVGHYDNLTLLIVIVNVLTLLPLLFLRLVPSMDLQQEESSTSIDNDEGDEGESLLETCHDEKNEAEQKS